jgi:hypothetical protein
MRDQVQVCKEKKIVPANLIKESRCFTQEPTNLIRFFPTIISVLFVIKISRWQKRKAKIIASNKQQIQLSVVKKLRFRFHRGFSIRPVQFDPPLCESVRGWVPHLHALCVSDVRGWS